ncbi:MAG: hypothetical protein ACLT3Y_08675 [Ruminococcus callidus]
MHTSNFLHSFELRTEENKVVLFFEMKYEKTLAFSSRMCYTTKVHKSYLIYAIKRVRHSGVCRRKVGAAFFTKETPHKGFAQDMPAVFHGCRPVCGQTGTAAMFAEEKNHDETKTAPDRSDDTPSGK